MSGHVVERLSPFLDGELSEPERQEIQSHLEGCADCAAHLADLAAVDAEARQLAVDAPPGYFEALPGRVRQRLRPRAARRLPAWGWAAAAALLLAVLLPRMSYEPPARQAANAARAPEAPPPTVAALPPTPPPEAVLEKVQPPTRRAAQPEARTPDSEGFKPSGPVATGRRDEERPGGKLEQDEAKKADTSGAPQQNFGFTTPPASAPAPATKRPEAEERAAADAEQQEPADLGRSAPLAAGAASKERRKQAFEEKGLADAKAKDELASAPRTASEARALRESARERARRHPEGTEGDEARLQMVEAGARAYELGQDPRDLEILKRDAQAYLDHRDARQPERVRERLRSLEERP